MITGDQKKLLNDIHSKIIVYLDTHKIKPPNIIEEIRSDMDISIGNSSDFKRLKYVLQTNLLFF